jgi:uncharacterized protein (TIGR00369 family)
MSHLNKFYQRVFDSFSRQRVMSNIGARLGKVDYGICQIELPYSENVNQQQGSFHGGIIGLIADNAAGYAGLTTAADDCEVVTAEYKINFLATFHGGKLIAKGKVIKPGKRLIVTSCEVVHVDSSSGAEKLCAVMQQTIIPVQKKY